MLSCWSYNIRVHFEQTHNNNTVPNYITEAEIEAVLKMF